MRWIFGEKIIENGERREGRTYLVDTMEGKEKRGTVLDDRRGWIDGIGMGIRKEGLGCWGGGGRGMGREILGVGKAWIRESGYGVSIAAGEG